MGLAGLLRSAPLQVRRVAAVCFAGAKSAAALVVADREGELVTQHLFRAEGDSISKLLTLLEQQKTHCVVLPASSPATDLVASFESQLVEQGVQVQRVRTAALAEARLPLTQPPERLSSRWRQRWCWPAERSIRSRPGPRSTP